MHRRAFIAAIAAGPIAVVAGPSCGPTNPPPDGVWIGGEWVSAAELDEWITKMDAMARELSEVARGQPRNIPDMRDRPCFDLREADPDRCMREWIKPAERVARQA